MSPAAGRLARDIDTIGGFSETEPARGCHRPTFSPSWRRARDYVAREAEEIGCRIRVDAAGNLHARPAGRGGDARAWLCGSHLDSVPTGGKYDGVTGVAAALELLRCAPEAPVELIVFAEEEGTTFGLGMLGSKAWAGAIGPRELAALRNAEGRTYLEAGAAHGVDPDRLPAERLDPGAYHGLIEVHVEQGASLWKSGEPLAVVTAINGRRQYACVLEGMANHAGSTTMDDRRDALAGAAECIRYLEALAKDLRTADGDTTVITVGRLDVQPNAINVIPGRAAFTIDFRSASAAVLDRGEERLRNRLSRFADARGLALSLERTESLPVVPLDSGVCALLRDAARRIDTPIPDTTSGALHDTAILAPLLPAAMLFVPSKDGISHNPAELSRVEHIALAVRVVGEAIGAGGRPVKLSELNEADRDAFMAVVGPVFEHSPWIAERAWARRPFATTMALHEALVAVVQSSSADEQLGLICAHPDLVGRVAAGPSLGGASSREQAAAGLDALSSQEAGALSSFNRAYRERFGFPFVICARENRKEVILAAFPERLSHTPEQEKATALREIARIAWLRLKDTVTEEQP